MKIAIGSDHAGFPLKQALLPHLKALGHQVEDVGAYNAEPSDYPLFAEKVSEKVATHQAEMGIAICGNGIGMSIAANKVPGVRAALCLTEQMAYQTRSHNDSNVLCLAGRDLPIETNMKLVDIWLTTPFGHIERHARRVNEIQEIEKAHLKL
jgi:ribose 5-phosphate isomerase B